MESRHWICIQRRHLSNILGKGNVVKFWNYVRFICLFLDLYVSLPGKKGSKWQTTFQYNPMFKNNKNTFKVATDQVRSWDSPL